MKKNLVITSLALCALFCMFPGSVEAIQDNAPHGIGVINKEAANISALLFGPVSKVAALFGGAIGLLTGFIQQSVTKILTFGGILLASACIPTFIDSFYTILIQ